MSALSELGPVLIEQGYQIVPIKHGYKYPKGLTNWQEINACSKQLNAWLSNGFAQGGVGVLTKHTPAIDIDVYDEKIVDAIVDFCDEELGFAPKRVGQAPKALLVFKAENSFKKLKSKIYIDEQGQEHCVEILGEGQQFVAYGTHPKTKKPFNWVNGPGISERSCDSLPLLTHENAKKVIQFFESQCPKSWRVKSETADLLDDFAILDNLKPKVNISDRNIKKTLKITEVVNHEYDWWLKHGMALWHQFDGSDEGFKLWDQWSSSAKNYESLALEKRWGSFEANVSKTDPVTFATIIKLAKTLSKNKHKESSFTLLKASEVAKKLGPTDWLIKGYMEKNATGMLFGDPSSYKSFIALDMGFHVATGRPWLGQKTQEGPVIYIAGEGHGGFARRVAAWAEHHGVKIDDSVPFFFSQTAARLHDEELVDEVTTSIDLISETYGQPALIVIDTLARNMGAGDENATADINVFVEHVDRLLRAKYSASVVIVHHTGHQNKQRARGAMALKGAVDFEYRAENVGPLMACLSCTKMKDAPEPEPLWLQGESVTVGFDEDNDEITSLVFGQGEAPVEKTELKGKQKAAFDLIVSTEIPGTKMSKKLLVELIIDNEISESDHGARMLVNNIIKKGFLIETEDGVKVNEIFIFE